MCFHEVVIDKVKRNRRFEILKLFTECESETRQPFTMRSHGQIRAFDVACANSRGIRVASDCGFVNSNERGRTVLTLIFSARG